MHVDFYSLKKKKKKRTDLLIFFSVCMENKYTAGVCNSMQILCAGWLKVVNEK